MNSANLLKLMSVGLESLLQADQGHVRGVPTGAAQLQTKNFSIFAGLSE